MVVLSVILYIKRGDKMITQRKRTDITSADSKQIGFDYQYLYFMVKLFQLSHSEEVGYEALDDVHTISFREQRTYFYQLKHTITTAADGKQSNLTDLSSDLWKTLSNWSKLITDESEGRKMKIEQKKFIDKSTFVFVVNRNMDSNEVISYIEKLKNKVITSKDFSDFLKQLKARSRDTSIIQYIKEVLKLGTSTLERFATHVEFVNTPDNLFTSIREAIRDKMIREEYVDDVLGNLYLQLKEDFFEKVRNGEHQTISYTEWITKYQGIFNQYRTTQLPIRMFSPELPDHLEKQNFVKELIEIGEIDLENYGLEEIAELTDHYLKTKLQLDMWYDEGRITSSIIKRFNNDAILQWKSIHKICHQTTKKSKDMNFQNALCCYYKIMAEKLTLLSTEIGMELSNGEFIKLADEEKIGWKYSWKDRYYTNAN